MSDNIEHIDSLIVRSLDHPLEPEEQQQLQTWLEEDIKHRQYYQMMKSTWDYTGQNDLEFEPDTHKNWETFKLRTLDKKMRVVSSNYRAWWMAAAVLAGLCVCILVARVTQHDVQVLTAANETKQVILPDGSKVFMNQQSTLRYSKDLTGAERSIFLEGEAYFEVTKQPARPFVVYANGTRTQVLGTTFDIKAYATSPVEIAVLTGRVSVSRKTEGTERPAENLVLTPGRKAIFKQDAELEENAIHDPNFMAWKERRLVFDGMQLKDVFETLEKFYSVKIILEDTSFERLPVRSTFDDATNEDHVLNVVAATVGLTWKKENGVVIFSKK
jgi:transmembrane sensor